MGGGRKGMERVKEKKNRILRLILNKEKL